ncbi:MAG: hypothetical protein QF398_05865, partial [Alphaproteobacteria bacterium]|nr:hypothetical protein [Alphaproteobacteria bacterium]
GADDGRSYPTEGSVVIREAQLFAYHDQVLGLDHAGISRHYLEAKKSGRYENVPTVYGRRLPAYAMASE